MSGRDLGEEKRHHDRKSVGGGRTENPFFEVAKTSVFLFGQNTNEMDGIIFVNSMN
jgi:hypothetical protein